MNVVKYFRDHPVMLFFGMSLMLQILNHCQASSQDTLRIGFGSCNHVNDDQSYWQNIDARDISYWIWLGDIVYSNTNKPSLIKRKYDRQKQNEHYRKFCSDTRVFGVWDDNDYGMGDGNRTYKIKEKSREMLFEFLDIPEDSRERLHTGAYQSNTIIHGDKHIKIILLDVRYFKDPLKRDLLGNNRYIKDPHATILGEQQWDWLENELDTSTADIHIIGSGIQVIPEQHPFEKWADYPNERERFWSLLRKHDPKNPILISGDRHMAEVSQLRLSKNLTIFEMTSSGLTHTWENFSEEANKHRIGELYARKNFAILNIYSNSGVLKLSGELYQTDGKLLNTYDFH